MLLLVAVQPMLYCDCTRRKVEEGLCFIPDVSSEFSDVSEGRNLDFATTRRQDSGEICGDRQIVRLMVTFHYQVNNLQ